MKKLAENIITKDKDALTSFILEHEEEFYKIAGMRLNNDVDICDAMQNTILLAYKNIYKLKNIEFLKTWIVKILINECNKIYRKNKKYMLCEDNQFEVFFKAENTINKIDDKLTINSLLKFLEIEERQILILYYSLGFNIKEISKILNKNENTIKTKMNRAKQKLKNAYGGEFYEK